MTLDGRTALSVEIWTNRWVPTWTAASTTLRVPNTLVWAASIGWCSSTGTCLWAAAWKTTSGRIPLEDVDHRRAVVDVDQRLVAGWS